MPRVSVLMPIYNTNPQHLRVAIESVLKQSFKDFEFLILNDSPLNKEIEKIVKDYANKDKRIKYYKNAKNIGISGSRNKLLKMAKGEYIAIFDHDDICVQDRFERQVKYLDEHPYIGVVSGWLEYFGSENFIHKTPEFDDKIKIFLTDNCYIAHTAAMIRKSVLIDNNIEYEEYYTPAEDYRLWARLMDVTNFYNIQDVLVKYRWDGNNTSVSNDKKMENKAEQIRIFIRDKHMFLYSLYKKYYDKKTIFKIRLFGIIPLLKLKKNTVYLFEIIPIFKIRYK